VWRENAGHRATTTATAVTVATTLDLLGYWIICVERCRFGNSGLEKQGVKSLRRSANCGRAGQPNFSSSADRHPDSQTNCPADKNRYRYYFTYAAAARSNPDPLSYTNTIDNSNAFSQPDPIQHLYSYPHQTPYTRPNPLSHHPSQPGWIPFE